MGSDISISVGVLITASIALLGLATAVFWQIYQKQREQLGNETYQQHYRYLYFELATLFVEAARTVLNSTSLHETNYLSKKYLKRLVPLEQLVWVLHAMRKHVLALGDNPSVQEIETPEFCYGMARFLSYYHDHKLGQLPAIDDSINFWVSKHREACDRDETGREFLRYSYFFQSHMLRKKACLAHTRNDKKVFALNIAKAEALIDKAIEVSPMYSSDKEPWLSAILEKASLLSLKYYDSGLQGDLEKLYLWYQENAARVMAADSVPPFVDNEYDRNVLAFYLNQSEISIALGKLEEAEDILGPVKTWAETYKQEVDEDLRVDPIASQFQMIYLAHTWILKVFREIEKIHLRNVRKSRIDQLRSGYREQEKRSGLADFAYASASLPSIWDYLRLKLAEYEGEEESVNQIRYRMTEVIEQSRDIWYFEVESTFPRVILRKVESSLEIHADADGKIRD